MSEIRLATSHDVPEINALIELSKKFWKYPETYLDLAIPLIQIKSEWLTENKGWVIGERPIQGFVGIEEEADGWLLDHLWIHPIFIRKGVGRRSVDFLIQLAQRNGVQKIRLLPDPPAENFYLKMGARYSGKQVKLRIQDGPVFKEMVFSLSPFITLKQLTGEAAELNALQRVLESAPNFTKRTTGAHPGSSDAQSTLSALPPNKTCEDKFVFNIYSASDPVGCIDVIRGYPDEHTAWIGLLLIDESQHGKGFGKTSYLELEKFIRSWSRVNRICLSVIATNERAVPFWKKMGFRTTGERKPYKQDRIESEVIIMEKPLTEIAR